MRLFSPKLSFTVLVATALTIVGAEFSTAISNAAHHAQAADLPSSASDSLSLQDSPVYLTQVEDGLPQLAPAQSPLETNQPIPDSNTVSSPEESPISIDWENAYLLGAGDRVQIDVFGAPEYSGESVVLPDGTLSLPTAGRVTVRGLTLIEAAETISDQYETYIRRPRVTLSLRSLRPVRVGVVGAVERPGTYTVSVESNGAITFPTLTDALSLAGGISSQADIRQIEVSRPSGPGTKETFKVDLWALLQSGNMEGDVLLRSGDTVSIPIATVLDPAEAVQLGAASFSPEAVTIYVVGEVSSPGAIEVPPNTPLNQALLAAGGFDTQRANDDKVGLVRLNADGSVERRIVAVDFTSDINEETNPILREDDVVIVERSGLASFSDTVGLAVTPIGRLLNGIFNIFNFLD